MVCPVSGQHGGQNLPDPRRAGQSCKKVDRPLREHPRYAHEAALTFRVADQPALSGRTRNLSRGGLCAELADPLPVGADVDVTVVLMFEDDMQSEALALPGRIVWCTPVDDAFQVGIAFRPVDSERAEYLAMFLGYLEAARADRPAREPSVDDRFR